MKVIKQAREKIKYFVSLPFNQKKIFVEGIFDGVTTKKPPEDYTGIGTDDEIHQYIMGYGYGTALQMVAAIGLFIYLVSQGELASFL